MISNPESPEAQASAAKDFAFSDGLTRISMLPSATIITRADLCKLLRCHEDTIRRAVDAGQFPRPARVFNRDVWTVGAITEHIGRMLQLAEVEHDEAMKA